MEMLQVNYLLSNLSNLITGFENMLWQVPITIATSENQNAYKFVLNQRSTSVTINGVKDGEWIKVL